MSVLDLLFPKNCLNCRQEGSYICLTCISKVKLAQSVCPECQRPAIDGMTHTKCKKKLGLDGLVCLWEYEGVIRKAILALKYKFASEIAKELAHTFVGFLQTTNHLLPTHLILVPIPLFWIRENWRGFNQAEEIGRLVAQKMGLRFVPDLLTRRKLTRPQTELRGKERGENIHRVFSLNPAYNLQSITNNLVIFDDVYTTGSTLKEAAKILKRSGVEKVWGLTIAR